MAGPPQTPTPANPPRRPSHRPHRGPRDTVWNGHMLGPRVLDRYVAKEVVVPFFLALIVFTFILQIPPVMEVAERLIAKGVAWSTVGRIMLTLLPQALGITIPMAVLVGLLVALGRRSADREAVALQACGISLYRLVVPVGVVAGLAWAATSWVLVYALPAANQAYREIVYRIVAARAENEVRPRVFFEDFPNLVLYVRDTPAQGSGWRDVFLADSRAIKASPNPTIIKGRVCFFLFEEFFNSVIFVTGWLKFYVVYPGKNVSIQNHDKCHANDDICHWNGLGLSG